MDIGILTADECVTEFQAIKMQKSHRFLSFKIKDYKEVSSQNYLNLIIIINQVVLDVKGDRDSTWEEFTKVLPKNENRYVVYDFDYTTDEKPPRQLSRLIFVYWSPDGSSLKDKTIYATNKEKFKGKITCSKEFQATDLSDVNLLIILYTILNFLQ